MIPMELWKWWDVLNILQQTPGHMTCPDQGWWSSECISQILITRERMSSREDFLAQQPVIHANIGWAILFWMHTTQAAQLDFDLIIHYIICISWKSSSLLIKHFAHQNVLFLVKMNQTSSWLPPFFAQVDQARDTLKLHNLFHQLNQFQFFFFFLIGRMLLMRDLLDKIMLCLVWFSRGMGFMGIFSISNLHHSCYCHCTLLSSGSDTNDLNGSRYSGTFYPDYTTSRSY